MVIVASSSVARNKFRFHGLRTISTIEHLVQSETRGEDFWEDAFGGAIQRETGRGRQRQSAERENSTQAKNYACLRVNELDRCSASAGGKPPEADANTKASLYTHTSAATLLR